MAGRRGAIRQAAQVVSIAALLLAAMILGVAPATSARSAGAAGAAPATWRMIALGDSIPYGGRFCDGCTSFVILFAREMAHETGHPIAFLNDGIPGLTTTQLLTRLRTVASVRSSVAAASVITITVGHNDTPWNSRHDACDGSGAFFGSYRTANWAAYTGPCLATVVNRYRATLSSILAEIRALRAGRTTLIRVTTDYNQVLGKAGAPVASRAASKAVLDAFRAATCDVARANGARCADVYAAFNGPSRTRVAGSLLAVDHDHPSQAGHRVIAATLAALGYSPLSP